MPKFSGIYLAKIKKEAKRRTTNNRANTVHSFHGVWTWRWATVSLSQPPHHIESRKLHCIYICNEHTHIYTYIQYTNIFICILGQAFRHLVKSELNMRLGSLAYCIRASGLVAVPQLRSLLLCPLGGSGWLESPDSPYDTPLFSQSPGL